VTAAVLVEHAAQEGADPGLSLVDRRLLTSTTSSQPSASTVSGAAARASTDSVTYP
jgi:hypothetical protein